MPPPSRRSLRKPSAKRPTGPPRVLLLVETSNSYARGLLTGIEEYIRNEGPWDVFLTENSRGDRGPEWLPKWEGDGIIARIENEDIAAALRELRIPIVDLSSWRHLPNVPTVTTDNAVVAKLAYEHLADRGFRNFAFCGVARFVWSKQRGEEFEKHVRRSGARFAAFQEDPRSARSNDRVLEAIAKWVVSLPKPVAIFTPYDERGQQVLAACRRAGVSVPDEVAVLGVDNDEVMCGLAPRPLSSVIPDTHRAGLCAAGLLAKMMAGLKVEPTIRRFPPIGVAARLSTDTVAVDDQRISGALRFIREHAVEGIRVEDVLERFPMARRSLEQRMKLLIGRAPHEEIRRVQLKRAQDLLTGSKLPLSEIAERCGFRYPEYLSVAFKRETGFSPRDFRKQFGRGN